MKKILTSLVIFSLIFLILPVQKAYAKVISDQKGSVVVAKTEVINDDLFVGAQMVEIDGTVNGDAFIGAQTVKIAGVINGNLHVGANTIVLGGKVLGNVYAGGQSVLVNSAVIGGSLLAGGGTVSVDKDATIGGSILAGAGTLTIDSQVKRSVYAGAGNLTLGSNTRIGKDLYYAAGKDSDGVTISSGAKIAGNTYKTETNMGKRNDRPAPKNVSGTLVRARLITSLLSFIGALIVGFIYLKLFPKHFAATANIVTTSFWKSLGVGFLVTIAFIPGAIILLITVVGVPVVGLALLLVIIYWYLAKIVVGTAFGNRMSPKLKLKPSNFWSLALGLFVIYLLRLIPFVGFFISLVIVWVGIGALTLRLFSKVE